MTEPNDEFLPDLQALTHLANSRFYGVSTDDYENAEAISRNLEAIAFALQSIAASLILLSPPKQ